MDHWKLSILKTSSILEEIINCLDKSIYKIVLIVDDDERLIGTITDGDIRRAIIAKRNMNSKAKEIMNNNPVFVVEDFDYDSSEKIMKSKNIQHLPIVDENRRIIDLRTSFLISDKKIYENPVFLLSGGLGERLRPLTDDKPKPLLDVGGKPILENIIEQFIGAGFYKFFLAIRYKGDMIVDHFGNGEKWGVEINYILEEEPLGTAGALGLLPKNLSSLPLIVMNGDVLTKVNFQELLRQHNKQNCLATVCVSEYSHQIPYGVVEIEGNFLRELTEKPFHQYFINAGIYVIEPSLLKKIDGNSLLNMTTLINNELQNNEKINIFPIHEYWLDIGMKDDYMKAKKESG